MKKILIIAGIIITCLLILRDPLIKYIITSGATKVVGAPVKINTLSLDFFKRHIEIKGLRIENPKGYPKGRFLDIALVSLGYDLSDLLSLKLRIYRMYIELRKVVIIKNKDGRLNVDALKVSRKEKSSQKMPMQIDVLTLDMGEVLYKDFTRSEEPMVEVFESKIKSKVYYNITSAQQLVRLILMEALKSTTIKDAAIYEADNS